MSEKRYAIVRVDYDSCPIKYKVPQKHRKIKCFPFKCDKCGLYGDTKEQLVRKVETAIKRRIKDEYIVMFGKVIKTRSLAKEIVEFLGVK